MSPKSALKEELSRLGKMKRDIFSKTEKKRRPVKKTKSSRHIKGEENKEGGSKMRRDSTFKEKDASPLKPSSKNPFNTLRNNNLKYSMTLNNINNIFYNIDEQENEEGR